MRFSRALVVLLAGVLLLAGCGGETETSAPADADRPYNQADVTFASDMIQHHAQALQMVDLTLGQKLDPKVADLAERIRAAQTPEIETMASWLQDWGKPVPETVRDHANAHDMSGGHMSMTSPGMMGQAQMRTLERAEGERFQQMWLKTMIEHHQGAIAMARSEQEAGENPAMVKLARRIESGQVAEVQTMRGLLA